MPRRRKRTKLHSSPLNEIPGLFGKATGHKIFKIEISFPIRVDIGETLMHFDYLTALICDNNVPEGYVLWPAEQGSKITYMPMTAAEEEERGTEFDDTTTVINCAIRRKHSDEEK